MKVRWTEQQGYAGDSSWVTTGPDVEHEGQVVGFVSENGWAKAVILTANILIVRSLDDLTVVSWGTDLVVQSVSQGPSL